MKKVFIPKGAVLHKKGSQKIVGITPRCRHGVNQGWDQILVKESFSATLLETKQAHTLVGGGVTSFMVISKDGVIYWVKEEDV